MRRFLLVICTTLIFVTFCSSFIFAYEKEIQTLSESVTASISKSGKKKIAVVDFTDLQSNITELGRFLAEELSVDVAIDAKNFSVIDRTHLKSILAEHKLSISGLVDPNTVKQLGQIAGVDAIVTGTVTPFGDSIRVTVKVITTDTAEMIGACKGDIAKTKAIEELLVRGIESAENSSTQNSSQSNKEQKPVTQIVSVKPANSNQKNYEAGVFIQEDFSKYEIGDPIPEWGASLFKLKGNSITTNKEGEFWLSQKVEFPADFTFEFEYNYCHGYLIFIDKKMDEFKINIYDSRNITLPNTKGVSFDRKDKNLFKLIKKASTYKIYVNGEYITSGVFEFDQFTEFKMTVKSHTFYTNFKGTALN